LTRELIEARLQSELRRKSPSQVSENEVARDWKLLQQTMGDGSQLTARSTPASETLSGNRP
jgi:hypothetical protein